MSKKEGRPEKIVVWWIAVAVAVAVAVVVVVVVGENCGRDLKRLMLFRRKLSTPTSMSFRQGLARRMV